MPNRTTLVPMLAAATSTIIFGFSFMFSRVALETLEPLHLLALRFCWAALILNGLRLFDAIRIRICAADLIPLLSIALLQPVLYFIMETTGISLTSASEAGMMVALIPIFTILLSACFLQERPSTPQVIAIVLSVGGVLLITVMQASTAITADFFGLLILLGAAISGAAYSVLSRHHSRRYSPLEITYVMMNFGAVVFLLSTILQHAVRGELTVLSLILPLTEPAVVVAIGYLGLFSSVAAFFLLNFALSRLSAAQVSAFPSLTTLIAVATGVLLLGESLFWYHIVGGMLIIIGVWGANYYAHPHPLTEPV